MFEEFGKVIISEGENFPKGLVLRTTKDYTVVLEEYTDTFQQNVDVIHVFGKTFSLNDEEDLQYCLQITREYEKDLSVPIHVFVNEESAATDNGSEKRAEFIARTVAWNRRHDWSIIPPT